MKYQIGTEIIEFVTILENPSNPTIFRHFKGKEYAILSIAHDSETKEEIVVYKALYLKNSYWTRKASMFFSDVDKEKYPEVTQVKRFEKVI